MKTSTFGGHEITHNVYAYLPDHDEGWIIIYGILTSDARPDIERAINRYFKWLALWEIMPRQENPKELITLRDLSRRSGFPGTKEVADFLDPYIAYLEARGWPVDDGRRLRNEPMRRLVLELAGIFEAHGHKVRAADPDFQSLIQSCLALAGKGKMPAEGTLRTYLKPQY